MEQQIKLTKLKIIIQQIQIKAMMNIQNRKQKRKFFIVTADLRAYFCYSRKISKMNLNALYGAYTELQVHILINRASKK